MLLTPNEEEAALPRRGCPSWSLGTRNSTLKALNMIAQGNALVVIHISGLLLEV